MLPSLLLLSAALLGAAAADKRATPATGAVVVDQSGTYAGSYTTVTEGVAALNASTLDEQQLFIFPGDYVEQVYIAALNGNLTVQGYTEHGHTYKHNQVLISYDLSRTDANVTSDDGTATFRLWSENTKLYNLNISNTFGEAEDDGQALALSAQATGQGFYGCVFSGFQDTVYANTGDQVYAGTAIIGAVDFIFGQTAVAWFDDVDITSLGDDGCLTANGREDAADPSFYVFNNAHIAGGAGVANGTAFLGRPWRTYSRVVYQESYMSDIINPAGWMEWDASSATNSVYYGEYNNFGPGSSTLDFVNWSMVLTEPVLATSLFGEGFESEFWVDATYLTGTNLGFDP